MLAETAVAFTSTEYILGGVVLALSGIIATLAKHIQYMNEKIEATAESRRKEESDNLKTMLPIITKVVEILDEIKPLLKEHK